VPPQANRRTLPALAVAELIALAGRGKLVLRNERFQKLVREFSKTVIDPRMAESLPVSDVGAVNAREMGQDEIALLSANDAPGIAFVTEATTDFDRQTKKLRCSFNPV
jgi:hypothetical protein